MDKQIETPLYQIYYKYHGVVKKVQVKDESKNISEKSAGLSKFCYKEMGLPIE